MTKPTYPVIVTHGGAGGPLSNSDGCDRACEAGLVELQAGRGSLAAAVEATALLEDDPRMNAGVGSNLRLDGLTIEMDAAVMDHTMRFGGVAAIQKVRYPIRVALKVYESPHLLLAGEGATRFARATGFPEFYPISDRARERLARIREFLTARGAGTGFGRWDGVNPELWWNFDEPTTATLKRLAGPSDTVGAVARDAQGQCAAALSTGGTTLMLLGRVGDTPIIGAGIYAGPAGAVAATGEGEEIMRRLLAKLVYDWIFGGMPAQEATERGVGLVPAGFDVGLIAVSRYDEGMADNRTMPTARRVG